MQTRLTEIDLISKTLRFCLSAEAKQIKAIMQAFLLCLYYTNHQTNVASIHAVESDVTLICLITISDKTEYDVLCHSCSMHALTEDHSKGKQRDRCDFLSLIHYF